jgi:hypothetical protein
MGGLVNFHMKKSAEKFRFTPGDVISIDKRDTNSLNIWSATPNLGSARRIATLLDGMFAFVIAVEQLIIPRADNEEPFDQFMMVITTDFRIGLINSEFVEKRF